RPSVKRFALPVIGVVMVGDLLLFAYGKRVTHDPLLYYPEVPALQEIVRAKPGRAIGIDCLPANIGQAIGLSDIRGFDSVDPERWLKLLWIGSGTEGEHSNYAATQTYVPQMVIVPPDEIRFPAVLDMLSVRYAIFRGAPSPGIKPRFRSEDYWVLENRHALPRVFLPNRVERVANDADVLRKLALPDFDPTEVAYVSANMAMSGTVRGEVAIKEEVPTRIVVDAQMQTRGLLVLADNWDKGWHAYVNGKRTTIVRANYTIRGVVLPAGSNTVEFRYESPGLVLGNRLATGALALLLAWTLVVVLRRRKLAHLARQILVQGPSPVPATRTA
ncbi:MAG TPA: YfhO family protein, partial [Polyangia bacterium]